MTTAHAAINDTVAGRTLPDWLTLIRSEYLEMPGLLLTRSQAQRLWGLDAAVCDALLGALVDAQFLRRTAAGAYVRADRDVRWPAPSPGRSTRTS